MSPTEELQRREIRLKGLPASPGIVMGKASVYKRKQPVVQPTKIAPGETEKHCERFKEARKSTIRELKRVRRGTDDRETAEILATQIEIVNDPDLAEQIRSYIEEELLNVGYAVYKAFHHYIEMITSNDADLLKDRVIDIEDMRDRLIQSVERRSSEPTIDPSSIVVTDELTPSDLVKLASQDMKALVMDSGGLTSHTSIIAHSIGITSVVGLQRVCQLIKSGDDIIVDGNEGVVVVRPSDETHQKYERKLEEQRKRLKQHQEILKQPSETTDGHPFRLRANIEFKEELPNLETYRAEGIGLLRTESLYLSEGRFGDYQAQEEFYKTVMEEVGNDFVAIRLFDAGGDKFYDQPLREDNPFLGWRGIRMLLDERELLRIQLEGILRVSGHFPNQIGILLPMVSTLEELEETRRELDRLIDSLKQEGVEVDENIQLGVMVEVPSVAIQAREFAKQVDFFSIGTNDLTQYTLAVDRGNELISDLYQQTNPAVWSLIDNTIDAANEYDINVAVCGEIAADPVAAACLVGMGIDDLSMAPASIPEVKEVLIQHSYSELKSLADKIRGAGSNTDIQEIFNDWK